jgi:hypothetical protein
MVAIGNTLAIAGRDAAVTLLVPEDEKHLAAGAFNGPVNAFAAGLLVGVGSASVGYPSMAARRHKCCREYTSSASASRRRAGVRGRRTL